MVLFHRHRAIDTEPKQAKYALLFFVFIYFRFKLKLSGGWWFWLLGKRASIIKNNVRLRKVGPKNGDAEARASNRRG